MNLVSKRAKGIPIAYLTGQVEFMGIKLISSPEVFIPKKQIEYLVTIVLDIIEKNFVKNQHLNIIDMCTGNGNIAIAVAMNVPKSRIYGADISKRALEIATKNAQRYHLNRRLSFKIGDLFDPLKNMHLENRIDIIICNPPYIPTAKIKKLDKSVINYEPLDAIDGGAFGLHYFIRVISDSVAFLKPGGFLVFEVGGGQSQSVAKLIERKGRYSSAKVIPCPGFNEEIVLCSLL